VEFLAILIALAILHLHGSVAPLQYDGWFRVLRQRVAARLSGARLLLVLVFLPAFVVFLGQRAAEGRLYGLAELGLFLVALFYALGRGNLAAALTDYLQRWSRGDFEAAFQQLSEEASAQVPEQEAVANPQALHQVARRRLYYRGFERVFAVLFWFGVLGPAGAVGYRLAVLEGEAARGSSDALPDSVLVHWLEWVPARLAGICFGLVGDFDACLYAWQRVLGDARIATVDALESCGNAALGLLPPAADESADALIARGTREMRAVDNLYRRALLAWLVIIAALAMIF
jgi:membrane protein required for beta-lactamase induction